MLGAYLAWTLLSSEVLFAAAKDRDMPKLFSRVSEHGGPKNAVLLTTALIQVLLVIVYFLDGALDFMLDLTAALSLVPFALVALYSFKIAVTRDSYTGDAAKGRTKDLIIGALTVIYTIFLIYAAGLEFLLLACILLAPATILYIITRRELRARVFTTPGVVVFIIVTVGAVAGIVGLATGYVQL